MRKRRTEICLAILGVCGVASTVLAQSSIENAKVPRSILQRMAPKMGQSKEAFAAIGRL